MIYAVSHDIGEPMREIIGFAELLARSAPCDADQRFWDDLGHVESGALRARAMLDALCEYLATEDLTPASAEVDLRELMASAIEATEVTRTLYPAHVQASGSGSAVSYPLELKQALTELLDNAARFAQRPAESAHIFITAKADDSNVHITVEDDGPGIRVDAQGRAMQLFQRLHRRSDHDTLGVGLALTRRRITACGGSIELDTSARHGGLKATISVPIASKDGRP